MVWEKLRKILVRLNGSNVGTTPAINFIEGSGIDITATYDAINNEIDLTVTNIGAGGGGLPDADYGDVVASGGGSTITIDTNAVTTTKINNKAVTYAKLQDTSAASILLGRGAGSGAGALEEITLGSGLTMTGTTLSASGGGGSISDGDKGDITVSSTGTVWTVDNDVVTFAKMQNIATDTLIGRSSAGTGDPEAITLTAAGRALIDDADASAQRTTLGLGSLALLNSIATSNLDNQAVTFVKMQNVSTGVLLGRLTAGTGSIEAITLTSFAATLLDDVDASAARSTLGLGSAALQASSAFEVPLTFSTGLTRTTNTITVNTSQNISTLSNLTANGFVKTSGGTGALSIDTNTYLTGNQSITLSGDVTGSGATAITTTLATVNSNTGTFGLAGSVAQFTVNAKGLITAAANVAISIASTAISDATTAGRAMLTAATATAQTALLDVFTSSAKGLAPASGGGTTNFLRADGTWAAPSGGGGGGGGNAVTATVDFGSTFTDRASVTVTGQSWVTSTSNIVAQVLNDNVDEAQLLKMEPIISDRVAGDGFTVSVICTNEAKGTYDVMCVGV